MKLATKDLQGVGCLESIKDGFRQGGKWVQFEFQSYGRVDDGKRVCQETGTNRGGLGYQITAEVGENGEAGAVVPGEKEAEK